MTKPLHLRADPDLTVIRAWFAGEASWIEFRAPMPYHLWGEAPHHAALLHDLLIGPHASVLHAGDTVHLLSRHPDYARVAAMVEQMDCARFPYLHAGRITDGTWQERLPVSHTPASNPGDIGGGMESATQGHGCSDNE